MQTRFTKLKAALLLAGGLAATPAFAANDAMMQLLKVLKDKGTLDEASYEALVNAAKADDEHVTFASDEVKRMNKELPKVDTKGKLEITSGDKSWKIRLGGRMHADATFPGANEDGNVGTGFGATAAARAANSFTATNFEDKYELRRMRLDATITAYDTWQGKVQYDFSGAGLAGLRDAYIKYLFKNKAESVKGAVTTGHFKEFIGLEELTSSNDISFIERSIMSASFNAANGRRFGIGANAAFMDKFTGSIGAFGRSAGDATDDGMKVTGRATFSPVHTKTRAAHIGLAGSYLNDFDNSGVAVNAYSGGFNPRPEFDHGTGTRPFGFVTNYSLFGGVTGTDNQRVVADDGWRFGAELAGVYGPWSLQAEYQRLNIGREVNGMIPTAATAAQRTRAADALAAVSGDLTYDGFYIFGSYMLTGESRNYRFDDGLFNNPKPSSPVGKGGWGAWELLARYSHVDLIDDDQLLSTALATNTNGTQNTQIATGCTQIVTGNTCGEEDNVTVGINWYPTENFKFMANYVKVLDLEDNRFSGLEPDAFVLRAQANW